MRTKNPLTLVDYAMKPLVLLTLSALQNLDLKNSFNETRCNKEPLSVNFAVKRKLENDSINSFEKGNASKRMRRRSLHCSDAVVIRNDEETVSKDDCFIDKCSLVDTVIILRKYFNCLPQNLWNKYFYLALKALNNLDSNLTNSDTEIRAFELLLCKKVSFFSMRIVSYYVYDKCEKLIYERLRLCRNLTKLEIHYSMRPESEETFLCSLSRLSHLCVITLLPNSKQSLHSTIPVISKQCKLLEEFIVAYNSEYMSDTSNNISCLQLCTKLRKLMLHSFGRGAEAQYIIILLYKLKGLKYFFHRELPHAITDIYSKCCKQNFKVILNLRVLLLSVYCKSVGSQLCYLPDESMVQIASVCPFLANLKLVRPSNLFVIAQSMPSLVCLDIHDCDVMESFGQCSADGQLKNLRSLGLKNIEHIDFGCILLISNCCPHLQELEISHSNLFWSNDLNQISTSPFPSLRKLTILKTPNNEQKEPRFVMPHNLYVDKTLIRYLLSNAKRLQELYLEFDIEAVRCRDLDGIPSEEELTSCIAGCEELKELMLLFCPYVSYRMINSFVESCPNLQHLWDIDLWEIPSREMDKILRNFSYMFVQSHERSNF